MKVAVRNAVKGVMDHSPMAEESAGAPSGYARAKGYFAKRGVPSSSRKPLALR